MNVATIAPGLWRWTGLHPDWTPAEGGPEGWPREVGCVYCETPEAIVLVDPLVPPESPAAFHEALERDVRRLGRPVAVLLTVFWHERSAQAIVERYGATLFAHPASAEQRPLRVTAGSPPPGVASIETARRGEVVYWLPAHRAIVAGDLLLGDDAGGLRVCPASWSRPGTYPAVLESVRALLDLPIERVLVSHGAPVLAGGRAALERALAARAPNGG